MMKVNINGCEWTILETNGQSAVLDASALYFGKTFYFEKIIYINESLPLEQKRKTLAHELTHAFLSETQIHYHDKNDEPYTEEMLCEFVGHYGEQISSIVNEYFK